MVDCTGCAKIYSGKCSDCPEHQAELEEYFGGIERRVRRVVSLLDDGGRV